MALHEIALERRTLHGHFSRALEPVLTVDAGDTVAFACLDAGWHVAATGEKFEPTTELDAGHALVGPIEVRGARAGQTLEVRIDRVEPGGWGWTAAGGWSSPLNERLGVADAERLIVRWSLADGIGRDQAGREVELRPFLGVIGMPPPEDGIHDTRPPRRWGGNVDCSELVAGSTLYLPVPVGGALLSAGDGHARQGDGEVSGTAIECPVERAELTLGLRDDLPLEWPLARAPDAWIAFGFDEDLDEAAAVALEGILAVLAREQGAERLEALALASVAVDLRVTQLVNGVCGVHAVLRDNVLR
ncbi:MAG TPA: acetamidase/formamidase family protein [Gaiellaceae bacterium]|nr:acetamidase/formamidase family protein [Gaiellaceae bacterium]